MNSNLPKGIYVVNILHDEIKKTATEQTLSINKKLNTDNGLQGQTTRTTVYNIGFARERVKCFD